MNNEEQNFTDAQMLRLKAEEQLKEKQKESGRPNNGIRCKKTPARTAGTPD